MTTTRRHFRFGFSAGLLVAVSIVVIALVWSSLSSKAGADDAWILQTGNTTVALRDVTATGASGAWAVGDNGTILNTTDGGVVWVAQSSDTSAALRGVTAVSANIAWAVGGSGLVLKTVDGGTNWNAQTTPTSNSPKGVSAVDGNIAWAVGASTILKTTDGGANWASQPDMGKDLRRVVAVDASTAWAVGSNVSMRTTDGGATWISKTAAGITLTDVVALDSETAWVSGGGGTIMKTSDGGTTWERMKSGTTQSLTGVSFINATTGWVVGDGGIILKTSDGGTTWTDQSSGFIEALLDVEAADGTAWAVGGTGIILRSMPLEPVPPPPVERLVITDATETNEVYVGGLGRLWTNSVVSNWPGQPLDVTVGNLPQVQQVEVTNPLPAPSSIVNWVPTEMARAAVDTTTSPCTANNTYTVPAGKALLITDISLPATTPVILWSEAQGTVYRLGSSTGDFVRSFETPLMIGSEDKACPYIPGSGATETSFPMFVFGQLVDAQATSTPLQ